MFENGLLRKLFGSRRVGLSRGWRKLYSEEFYDLYSLPNIIQVKKAKEYEMGGQCGTHEGEWVHRDCCRLTRRQETTRKTKARMGGQH